MAREDGNFRSKYRLEGIRSVNTELRVDKQNSIESVARNSTHFSQLLAVDADADPIRHSIVNLADGLAEGRMPEEIFKDLSDLLKDVSMVSASAGGIVTEINDTGLWRFDPKGMYLRLSENSPEQFLGFGSISLGFNTQTGHVTATCRLDPNESEKSGPASKKSRDSCSSDRLINSLNADLFLEDQSDESHRASKKSGPKFSPGDKVVIPSGKLKGKTGTIVKHLKKRGKWGIEMDDTKKHIAFREDELQKRKAPVVAAAASKKSVQESKKSELTKEPAQAPKESRNLDIPMERQQTRITVETEMGEIQETSPKNGAKGDNGDDKLWAYVRDDGVVVKGVTASELRQARDDDDMRSDHFVIREGWTEWRQTREIDVKEELDLSTPMMSRANSLMSQDWRQSTMDMRASAVTLDFSETSTPRLTRMDSLTTPKVSTRGNRDDTVRNITLDLADGIAKGVKPEELFEDISDLLDRVAKITVHDDGAEKKVTKSYLWRFDPKGMYIRLSEDDPEVFFGFECLTLDCQMTKHGYGHITMTCRKAK